MPVFTQGKDRSSGSVGFDKLFIVPFANVTVTKSVANSAIAASVALPCNVKILQVSVYADSANADVTYTGVNIVAGSAAEGTTGTANTAAVSGTILFAADSGQAPAITTAYAVTNFPVPSTLVDVVWPDTLALTLRLVSPNVGTASGSLHVSVLCKAYDLNPTLPLYNAGGTALQI